eukprot:357499-Chlamydomonas_euryale.AAC.3
MQPTGTAGQFQHAYFELLVIAVVTVIVLIQYCHTWLHAAHASFLVIAIAIAPYMIANFYLHARKCAPFYQRAHHPGPEVDRGSR